MQVEGTVLGIITGNGKKGPWAMAQIWDKAAKQPVKLFFDPAKQLMAEGMVGTFTVRPTDDMAKFRLVGEVGSNA